MREKGTEAAISMIREREEEPERHNKERWKARRGCESAGECT
jgi:hypothetical protein